MKWLTRKQVKEYATTPRKALEITIKHWWQNATASEKESSRGNAQVENGLISGDLCGLCYLYSKGWRFCKKCPLDTKKLNCFNANSPYDRVADAYTKWNVDKGLANFQAWQQAARNMHKVLCSLRKK